MRLRYIFSLSLVLTLLAGCSKYSEGDKVFVDVTDGDIEQSAYVQGSVIDEKDGKVSVHIDALHCESECSQLSSERVRSLQGEQQAVFPLEQVKNWKPGKAAYDERIHAYHSLVAQRQQQGVYYRVAPKVLASVRPIMQRDGFSGVLDIISLAELEQQYFTDTGEVKSLSEVMEAFPAFFTALKEKLKSDGLYQDARRLRSEADLATLHGNPHRLYLSTLFYELEALQGVYQQYLTPKAGDDMAAMSLHFRYVENALIDGASQAMADFYSDDCQALPAGQTCDAYRDSFRQRAMHQMVMRLRENLAQEVAGKSLPTEQDRVNESMSLLRFILNLRGKFSDEDLPGRDELDAIVRENAH